MILDSVKPETRQQKARLDAFGQRVVIVKMHCKELKKQRKQVI